MLDAGQYQNKSQIFISQEEKKQDQDGWLPPAYFAPSQLGKDDFVKDESVFPEKTLLLHHFF